VHGTGILTVIDGFRREIDHPIEDSLFRKGLGLYECPRETTLIRRQVHLLHEREDGWHLNVVNDQLPSLEKNWRREEERADEDQRQGAVEEIRVDAKAETGDEKRSLLLAPSVGEIGHTCNARENDDHQAQSAEHD
jgi:hypothetical protein